MVVDLQIQHDAEQMRLLVDSSAWTVLSRYLTELRESALRHLLNPSLPDQETHHWRGVLMAHAKTLQTPQEIIDYAKAQRHSA